MVVDVRVARPEDYDRIVAMIDKLVGGDRSVPRCRGCFWVTSGLALAQPKTSGDWRDSC